MVKKGNGYVITASPGPTNFWWRTDTSATDLFNMDTKMDDGLPATGNVGCGIGLNAAELTYAPKQDHFQLV